MGQLTSTRHRPAAIAPAIPPGANRARRVIVAGLVGAAALVALHAITQAIDFGVFNLRLQALNADYHLSVFGVASLLAQAAAAAAMGWRGSRAERHRWAWFTLGALVAGLIVVRASTHFNATALAVPLACVFCLLCWLTWRDPVAARVVVWAGLILLVTSLLLHKVGIAADSSPASDYTWKYQIIDIVKHGAELAGWMLLATGIVAGIIDRSHGASRSADGVASGDGILRRPTNGDPARRLVGRNEP